MSDEDILPTYAEAMKLHQTPFTMLQSEAKYITFQETAPSSSKIKSYLLGTEYQPQTEASALRRSSASKIFSKVEKLLTSTCCSMTMP